jgi:hypothetical protein
LSPANRAVGVPVDADIVLTFDEAVLRGNGGLTLFDVFGNPLFDTALLRDVSVTAVGPQLRIDPAFPLPGNVTFQVATSFGVAQDLAGNQSLPLPVYQFTTASDPLDRYRYGTTGNDTFTPTQPQQVFVGGPGVDMLVLPGPRSAYQVSHSQTRYQDYTITNVQAGTQHEALNMERVQFADSKLALDLDGGAAWVAEILGAVFGRASVANPSYVGIGLRLADAGTGFVDLLGYALRARFGAVPDSTALVQTLYTNVAGVPPPADVLALFVGQLDRGELTAVDLGQFAALHPANLANIDLVGLAQTGLPCEP